MINKKFYSFILYQDADFISPMYLIPDLYFPALCNQHPITRMIYPKKNGMT
jgi:hypothetical protein